MNQIKKIIKKLNSGYKIMNNITKILQKHKIRLDKTRYKIIFFLPKFKRLIIINEKINLK